MTKKNPSRIWVDSEFKKELRKLAAEKNSTVLDVTRELANKKKKNEKFDWSF